MRRWLALPIVMVLGVGGWVAARRPSEPEPSPDRPAPTADAARALGLLRALGRMGPSEIVALPPAPVTYRGVVVSARSGRPIRDAVVEVCEWLDGACEALASTTTRSDGTFVLDPGDEARPAGAVLVLRIGVENFADEIVSGQRLLDAVEPAGARIELHESATIRGRVLDTAGALLTGLDVTARRVDATGEARSAEWGPDGYELSALGPGEYDVVSIDESGSGVGFAIERVHIGEGEVRDLDMVMSEQVSYRISGRLVDAVGLGVAFATVRVLPKTPLDTARFARLVTHMDGRFEADVGTEGPYFVEISAPRTERVLAVVELPASADPAEVVVRMNERAIGCGLRGPGGVPLRIHDVSMVVDERAGVGMGGGEGVMRVGVPWPGVGHRIEVRLSGDGGTGALEIMHPWTPCEATWIPEPPPDYHEYEPCG